MSNPTFEPMAKGLPNWHEKYNSDLETVFEQLTAAVDAADSEEVERLERNLRALIEELRVGIGYDLEGKVDREEFQQSQQKQDFTIESLKQALDTGFTGTSVVHTFAAGELQHWKGWDGGIVEGAVNSLNQLVN